MGAASNEMTTPEQVEQDQGMTTTGVGPSWDGARGRLGCDVADGQRMGYRDTWQADDRE